MDLISTLEWKIEIKKKEMGKIYTCLPCYRINTGSLQTRIFVRRPSSSSVKTYVTAFIVRLFVQITTGLYTLNPLKTINVVFFEKRIASHFRQQRHRRKNVTSDVWRCL